jgi:hypothetical protein
LWLSGGCRCLNIQNTDRLQQLQYTQCILKRVGKWLRMRTGAVSTCVGCMCVKNRVWPHPEVTGGGSRRVVGCVLLLANSPPAGTHSWGLRTPYHSTLLGHSC